MIWPVGGFGRMHDIPTGCGKDFPTRETNFAIYVLIDQRLAGPDLDDQTDGSTMTTMGEI